MLRIATFTGSSYCATVANSWMFIWIEPSPAMSMTTASGRPNWAPIAAGKPYPIVPRPPDEHRQRGFLKTLEEKVREVGVAPENRPFNPHLTLGRVKYLEKGSRLPRRLAEVDLETVFVTMERIILFRSDLKPDGPVYTPLKACDFGK